MEQFLLNNRQAILLSAFSLVLVAVLAGGSAMVRAQSTENIAVSATVEAFLDFTVGANSTTLLPVLVTTAGVTNIASSSPNITMDVGTNDVDGWTVTIQGRDTGLVRSGGASSTAADFVASVVPTSTLAAGTDGYGVHATTSFAGVVVGANYNFWDSPEIVGEATTTARTMLTKTSANAATTVGTMRVKAAAASDKTPGTFQDVIALTAAVIP